ncbi:MAG: phosphoribosylformylglycinamidine cyclo-ligase [Myxococcota bacterium]
MTRSLTYRDAGVDAEAGDRLVDAISEAAKRTHRPGVMAGVGGFASLFQLMAAGKFTDPVLVSGTDGVGTKLKVAFMANKHDTVGQDLVAMCVNDVLTTGALPLFFLDYFACGKLEVGQAQSVITGIARACEEAQIALVGGETAEMPGLYDEGEYDLAGFAVGVVERSQLIDGSKVRAGDALVGMLSTGIHSNGLSLARKIIFERMGRSVHDPLLPDGTTAANALLTPTALYTRAVTTLCKELEVRALSHITGSGLPGNLPRVLPKGLAPILDPATWPTPPLFKVLADGGNVSPDEMYRTFNMGLGMVAVVRQEDAQRAVDVLGTLGQKASVVGRLQDVGSAPPFTRILGVGDLPY